MSNRFFVDQVIASQHVEVGGAEAHHLINVMRAKVGDEITLFDGSGVEFLARLTDIARSAVHAKVLEERKVDCELDFVLTLGVTLPKGDRQKWLVEKAVELGVSRLVPLQTDRTVVRAADSTLDKLRRVVVEASKQCGRNRLMQIDSPLPLTKFLSACPTESTRLLADPSGQPFSINSNRGETVFEAIGPEGGFTEDELSLAVSSGWQIISLGSRILRTETAAIAVASSVILSAALQNGDH